MPKGEKLQTGISTGLLVDTVYTGLLVEVPIKHRLCKICTSSLYRSSRKSLQTQGAEKKNVLQVRNLKTISVIQF